MPYVTRERDTFGVEGPVGSSLYGVCHTASSEQKKIVDLPDFDMLRVGVTIHVKFAYSNAAEDPTMDVNGTGELPLRAYEGAGPGVTASSSWNDGSIVTLTYDGEAWVLNDWSNADGLFVVDDELSDTSIRPVQNRVIKQALDSFAGILHYRGVKARVENLPSSGNVAGDVWLVQEDNSEYIWNGVSWEKFGPTIDLSAYATIEYVDDEIDGLTKDDVGLGNVDNTADSVKEVKSFRVTNLSTGSDLNLITSAGLFYVPENTNVLNAPPQSVQRYNVYYERTFDHTGYYVLSLVEPSATKRTQLAFSGTGGFAIRNYVSDSWNGWQEKKLSESLEGQFIMTRTIEDKTNFNNFVEPGFYEITSSTTINVPDQVQRYFLIVFDGDSGKLFSNRPSGASSTILIQMAIAVNGDNSGHVYTRSRFNSSWSTWVSLVTSSQIPEIPQVIITWDKVETPTPSQTDLENMFETAKDAIDHNKDVIFSYVTQTSKRIDGETWYFPLYQTLYLSEYKEDTNISGTIGTTTIKFETSIDGASLSLITLTKTVNYDTDTTIYSISGPTNHSFELVILSYGHSTWQNFIDAYTNNKIVYCRASSNSDPSSGSQTRMAFMAYVNNAANPTEVEFQYYRSVSSHTASQQGDQVFVYKLTSANSGTWTVITREASSKIVAGTGLGSSYSNGALTLTADVTGIRGSSESSYRTGNVTIAKADIGLGNVDNTSDVNKPVSTAQQTALNLKAPLASPALTGTPTAPTPTSSSGNTQIANKEYVDNHVPDLSGYMQKGVDYVTAGQLSGTTLGSKATAEGDYATASGQYSHAEGNHTTASGIGSHAEGAYAEASASYAHAEGGNTTASDNYSHAEGEYTEASGEASHAEGGGYYNRHSTASGDYSHVEGSINVASGHSSHAEGQGNTASGNYSHAGGGVSEASASASFAHGVGLIADQENGFAFGKYNKTIAHSIDAVVTVGNDASFNSAEQILAITLSNATIRMNVVNNNGYTYFVYKDHTGTITYPLYFEYDTYKKATDTYYNHYKSPNLIDDSDLSTRLSFGYANITSTSPTPETLKNVVVNENNVNYQVASVMDSAESGISILEMIGNGSDSSHRSNARTLDSNGNETLAGKLTLGTAPENDMDAATKKYVDDNSSDIQVRQSNSTGNQNKRVLLSTAANDNTETGEVYKSGSLTYNPSLATLYCTKYSVANAVVISYDSTEQAIIFTF